MGQLLDFARGQAEAAEEISAHLASGCPRCQANLDWLRKLIRLTASDDSVEPPTWLFHRAVRLFQQQGPEPKPSLLERITAVLTFDSFAQMQPVGVRQTAPATRQCVYQAGEWDVDLSFEAAEEPDTINLTGQVLHSREPVQQVAGVVVRLAQGENVVASTVTDRIGEFTFDSLASGTYDLIIDLREQEIQIEGLELKLGHA